MKVCDLVDSTQESIIPHLRVTENLLRKVGKHISGKATDCEIVVMEDLGLSHNILRMRGGFYTGIYVMWDCIIPFIPIDTTINSCAASLYSSNSKLSFEEFKDCVKYSEQVLCELGNTPIFNVGNHFISYCYDDKDDKYYLLLHGSENAHRFGKKGLYPREDTWYFDKIQIINKDNRYIRYIEGEIAEKFFRIYKESEDCTQKIHDIIAYALLSGSDCERVLYKEHYGMPDISSVAIGCQWKRGKFILLTSEGKNIYILENRKESSAEAFPHGFGVRLKEDCRMIDYIGDEFRINNINIVGDFDRYWYNMTTTRFSDKTVSSDFVESFLKNRNIRIEKELRQLYSYSSAGFNTFYC